MSDGQQIRVKVLEADDKGRLRLSMKAVLAENAPTTDAESVVKES